MSNPQSAVLFVCLGNICRSPTAHGVFQKLLADRGLTEAVEVDSAGTAAYHIGKGPDHRSVEMAARRGFDLSPLRARQVTVADFHHYDLILAMDYENLENLQAIQPANSKADLRLFLSFSDDGAQEVPDPYYGGEQGFERVLDLVESASLGLLDHLTTGHG